MLTDPQKRAYARQILLPEVGFSGQERICASRVCVEAHDDVHRDAHAIASEYLARAGVQLTIAGDGGADDSPTGEDVNVRISPSVLAGLAEHPSLAHAARFFAGAWHAVEALKQVLPQGRAASLPDTKAFMVTRAKETL